MPTDLAGPLIAPALAFAVCLLLLRVLLLPATQRWFLDHPRSVGEGYLEHQRMALGFGAELIAAGAACLVHALIPCLFQHTASHAIARLSARVRLRSRQDSPAKHHEPAHLP